MSDFGIGFILGICTGYAYALVVLKGAKPWCDLTPAEKRTKYLLMGVVGIGVAIAAIFLFHIG